MTFAPLPSACPEGRRAVREFCLVRGLHALAHDAELLTSELLTNGLRHARSLVTLRAVDRDGALFIHVTDDGEDSAELTSTLAAPGVDHGRGLFLVNSIAGDWGVIGGTNSKTTWFRIP